MTFETIALPEYNEGRSPIADADFAHTEGEPGTPPIRGLNLPLGVLRQVYHANAPRILLKVESGGVSGSAQN